MEPISRRAVLLAGGAAVAAATPLWANSSPSAPFQPDLVAWLPDGVLQVTALSDRAFRVRFVPIGDIPDQEERRMAGPNEDQRLRAKRSSFPSSACGGPRAIAWR